MSRIVIAVLFIFLQISTEAQHSSSGEQGRLLDPDDISQKVDDLVKEYLELDIFSGVVLVTEMSRPIYHKAFGLANRATNTPNTLNTKFDIGSMNKTFTKVLILQLLQEGKLSLSDKLGKYLSGFPKVAAEKITIDQLLNFRSGYGDYYTPGYFELPLSQKNIASLVERIRKLPLHFKPGTDNMYSNAGYILLGAIIEKITGKSYHLNVKNRIVKPLGLSETYVDNKHLVPERSIGYFKTMTGELEDNNGFLEVPNPDGGFQSTTLDIFKFYDEYHYGHKLLTEKTKMKDEFYSAIQAHKDSGGAIPHAGGYNGANTAKYEILRDKITIIVFANMDEPVAEQLGKGILDIVRGKTPELPALPAIQLVYKEYKKNGVDYVERNFEKLITNFHPTDPKDIILNQIGYEFLEMNKVEDAISIFKLNTKIFPEVANVWDSLGEAYYQHGDKHRSLAAYQKALTIDPEIPSAQEMVKKMSKE